jgi:hypothetical protein
MTGRLKRLRGLVINRVAFVPKGDNPEAEILLFKAAPEESGASGFRELANQAIGLPGSDTKEEQMDAQSAVLIKAAEVRATAAEARAVAAEAMAKASSGLSSGGTVAKADAAAGELMRLVKEDLQLAPFDRHGKRRTREQALAVVVRTPEGRAAKLAIDELGKDGQHAVQKALGHVRPEQPTREPSLGEKKLRAMADAHAAEHGITKEQGMLAVMRTPEGKAAYAEA